MKSFKLFVSLLLCVWLGANLTNAQVLTEHTINTSLVESASKPHQFTEYNGKLYFIATPGAYQFHIFEYDPGTGNINTVLATDELYGNGEGELVVFNGLLYIGTYANLISYDGTDTTLVASYPNTNGGCGVKNFTVFGSELIYTAMDPTQGPTVHSYDGVTDSIIFDATTYSFCYDQHAGHQFTTHNGSVWWAAEVDGIGRELVQYDGTTVTTHDIRPGASNGSWHPTSTPFGLVCTSQDAQAGIEPHYFDGTNFNMIANLNGTGSSSMQNNDRNPFGSTSNAVYFSARGSSSQGHELWKWDGTDTMFVADINPGSSWSDPWNFQAHMDTVYFIASTDSGNHVYCYDGTTHSQVFAANLPGEWADVYDLAIQNGMLYAVGEEGDGHRAIWAHDLSTGTTTQIASTFHDPNPTHYELVAGANALYLEWPGNSGWEPTMISGTTVTVLGDINTEDGTADIEDILGYSNNLYVLADDGIHGTEPHIFDPLNMGAGSTVIDVHPGPDYSEGEWLYEYNGNVLVETTWSPLEDQYGDEIFYFTNDTVDIFADINPGSGSSDPENFATLNGVLYFSAEVAPWGNELWQYDGTTASLVADIYPGGQWDSSDPYELTAADGKLYFNAYTDDEGNELWVHDPAVDTTYLLVETAPMDYSGDPEYITSHNGELYWSGYDENYRQLWKWNGTDTVRLSGGWSYNPAPRHMLWHEGFLYMSARMTGFGEELVRYDPVQDTAGVVADIYPGTSNSAPSELTVYNNKIFFRAEDGTNGDELWVYDPATNTTSMAADIWPGSEDGYPESMTVHANTLWFAAEGGSTGGVELWSYYETPAVPNLRERQLQDTSVHLEWDTIAGATLYKIWWKEASAGSWNVEFKYNNQGKRILNGLTPSTNYRWKIAVRSQGMWGPVSEIQTFKTLANPCETPWNLLTNPIGTNIARLNWGNIANVAYYKIRWREAGGTWNVVNKDAIVNKMWLNNLVSGTSYQWQMKAICPGDPVGTPWSHVETFMTSTNKWDQTADQVQHRKGTVLIAPNPNNGQFNIAVGSLGEDVTLQIIDPLGRLVYQRRIPAITQTTDAIDLSRHASGLYHVRLIGDSINHTQNMIVR